MTSYINQFRVKSARAVKLADMDASFSGGFKDRKQAEPKLAENLKRINALQELLYAEHRRSLLICLQAVDAGGKDGLISHVFGAMNPQGCRVISFKQPTSLELDHDFMWRAYKELPRQGDVAVFNRSYYEDVLVTRVHKLVPQDRLEQRYGQINAIEKHLSENGTHILKFFLHIDQKEQLERFKDRLDDPAKHWKISESDYKERRYWNEYQKAFETMLARCSTPQAPWFVIPANHKWFRDLAVSQILVEYLDGLNMKFPQTSVDIAAIRKKFAKEK